MSEDKAKTLRRAEAIKRKKTARKNPKTVGFGSNRLPKSRRTPPKQMIANALDNVSASIIATAEQEASNS